MWETSHEKFLGEKGEHSIHWHSNLVWGKCIQITAYGQVSVFLRSNDVFMVEQAGIKIRFFSSRNLIWDSWLFADSWIQFTDKCICLRLSLSDRRSGYFHFKHASIVETLLKEYFFFIIYFTTWAAVLFHTLGNYPKYWGTYWHHRKSNILEPLLLPIDLAWPVHVHKPP